jgi:hypothetical protein
LSANDSEVTMSLGDGRAKSILMFLILLAMFDGSELSLLTFKPLPLLSFFVSSRLNGSADFAVVFARQCEE